MESLELNWDGWDDHSKDLELMLKGEFIPPHPPQDQYQII